MESRTIIVSGVGDAEPLKLVQGMTAEFQYRADGKRHRRYATLVYPDGGVEEVFKALVPNHPHERNILKLVAGEDGERPTGDVIGSCTGVGR